MCTSVIHCHHVAVSLHRCPIMSTVLLIDLLSLETSAAISCCLMFLMHGNHENYTSYCNVNCLLIHHFLDGSKSSLTFCLGLRSIVFCLSCTVGDGNTVLIGYNMFLRPFYQQYVSSSLQLYVRYL